MSDCVKCEKRINDNSESSVNCVVCSKWTHVSCTKLTKQQLKSEEEACKRRAGTFKCYKCEVMSTPMKEIQKTLDKLLLASSKHSEDVKSIKEDVRKLSDSVEFCSSKFDEFKLVVEAHEKRLTSLEKETDNMKTEISQLNRARVDYNNHSRLNNIEISGLPESTAENLVEMMTTFGANIKVNIQPSDIDKIHRIPTFKKKNPRPVVVRFTSNIKKTEILEAVKLMVKEKQKITAQVFGSDNRNLVFVNHHLTPDMKYLHKLVRDCRPNLVTKTGVLENGKIWAVLNDTAKSFVYIRNMEDLNKIKSRMSTQLSGPREAKDKGPDLV